MPLDAAPAPMFIGVCDESGVTCEVAKLVRGHFHRAFGVLWDRDQARPGAYKQRNEKSRTPYFGNEDGFHGVDEVLLEILDRGQLGRVKKFETCLRSDCFGGVLPLAISPISPH